MPGVNLLCAAIAGSGTPDDCCGPDPVCGLLFQVKEGAATLCGHSEFSGAGAPSSPPKKYREKKIAGQLDDRTTILIDCTGPFNSEKYEYSGVCTYAAAKCAITNTLLFKFYNNAGTYPATTLVSSAGLPCNYDDGTVAGADCLGTTTVTKTKVTYTGTGDCCATAVPDGRIRVGTFEMTLNQEDTEDAAISRANAAISGWAACLVDCKAFKEARGAGDFTLEYRSLQLAVTAGGTAPGGVYNTTINILRRPYGTADAWELWIQMTHQFVGPATPATTYTGPWLSVPVQSGYEVQASFCSILRG